MFYLVSQSRISLDSGSVSLDKLGSLQRIHFLKIIFRRDSISSIRAQRHKFTKVQMIGEKVSGYDKGSGYGKASGYGKVLGYGKMK